MSDATPRHSPAVLKDRYRLERVLGHGGMAAVWLGHDEVLDRPVAVKLPSDAIASDPDFAARFRREAKVAGGVSHPSLVDVYDYSEAGERPYLVMELVPGSDLGRLIEEGVEVDRDRLAEELLGAVAHIHEAGILHRDIKPGNLVIGPEGTAKLIDFGIALPRDATALTQTGLVLGTERYAAPEVMAGEAASERSDLYSCGVVLRACPGEGSLELEALIGRLLSPDPRHRPASARQALAQLERGASPGEPTAAYAPPFDSLDPEPTTPTALPSSPPARRRWAAAVALVGALAAVAIVVALVAGSGDDERGLAGNRPVERSGAEKGQSQEGKQEEGEAPAVAPEAEAEPSAAPEPAGTDTAQAAALNDEGYELLQAGRYEAAIPRLEESVAAFPTETGDISYAYALFNLGNALRLSGRAAEAIPILEERLTIPDQTAAVEAELEAARREAE